MILVTGATGLNGSELVRRLSAKGVQVRALVRNKARAEKLSSLPMVEIVEGDMGKEWQVSPIIQTVFGWQPTSFDEFAKRNTTIFRGEEPAPKI